MSTRRTVVDCTPIEKLVTTAATMSLTGAFDGHVSNYFGEFTFPASFGTRLSEQDIELYVGKRECPVTDNTDYYERQLHTAFWPEDSPDCPFLMIQGREGVGKTTLLRYYFDYYLPERLKPRSLEALDHHIVIDVNLRRRLPTDEVRSVINERIVQVLRAKAPNVTEENAHAMWDRLADWSSSHHELARTPDESVEKYRAKLTAPLLLNHNTVAEEALWYLTSSKHSPRYFVTIVLDNLDQQDLPTQLEILQIALRWLGDRVYTSPFDRDLDENGLNLWRVIVPVRPETLNSLRHVLHPIDKKKVITLGGVNQELLIENRGERLHSSVAGSRQQFPLDIRRDGYTTCIPIPSYIASDGLRRMVMVRTSGDAPDEQVTQLTPPLREDTQELLQRFCNQSNRRLFRLRKRLIMNPGLGEAMLKAAGLLEDELDSLDNAVVSRYRFISAWLSGKEEYFDESDFENDVLNLYRTTKTEQGPHSLLVGPLVLHLLRHDYLTRSSIVEALTDIGFRASEVKSCLGSMHASDFFRYSGATSIENDEILVETDVLEAHWELLASAAYTDCMALVTPLPESIVGEDMSFSVYHKATHFETRTRTAFHFLEQIKADEIAVSTWRPNTERSKTSADVFSSRFRSLQIPSIYRLVSEPYLHRLHALRDKQMMRQDVNWSELLGDRLETIRKCPQTLTPLIVNK